MVTPYLLCATILKRKGGQQFAKKPVMLYLWEVVCLLTKTRKFKEIKVPNDGSKFRITLLKQSKIAARLAQLEREKCSWAALSPLVYTALLTH